MTEHCITTTPSEIIEARDVARNIVVSCGVADGAKVVYIRLNDVGDGDLMLDVNGTTIWRIHIPAKRRVFAWTNAGTACMCEMRVE